MIEVPSDIIQRFPFTLTSTLSKECSISKETIARRAKALGLRKNKKYLSEVAKTRRAKIVVPKGENHYNWKGGKPWKRFADPKYLQWRNSVLQRDNYVCQHCGRTCKKSEKGLAAHYLKAYAKYPELRFDINNGITLCRECHMREHGKNYVVEYIPCACGCGTLIRSRDIYGSRPRKYVNHHGKRGKCKQK
jgi:5-methylcytosine-specific restriction endonuclease McrA